MLCLPELSPVINNVQMSIGTKIVLKLATHIQKLVASTKESFPVVILSLSGGLWFKSSAPVEL